MVMVCGTLISVNFAVEPKHQLFNMPSSECTAVCTYDEYVNLQASSALTTLQAFD